MYRSFDNESSAIPFFPTSELFSKKMRTVEMVSQYMLFCHTEIIVKVRTCLLNIGAAFTYFPYHVIGNALTSIPYLCEGEENIRYVEKASEIDWFERAGRSYMLSPNFLNGEASGARQTIALKTTNFDPKYQSSLGRGAGIFFPSQPRRHSVSQTFRAFHGGLSSDSTIGKATSCAIFP